MIDDDSQTARGVAAFGRMHPAARTRAFAAATDAALVGGRLQRLAANFVFGRLWDDDGDRLDPRSRSLVTLGALVALRATEEVGNHARVGLANGLTRGEIEEAVTHCAAYAGFPAAYAAMTRIAGIFADEQPDDAGGVPAGRTA